MSQSTTVITPSGLKRDPVEDDRDAKHFSHRREKRKCRRKTSEYGDLVPKVQHDAQPNVLQRSRHHVSGQELRLHDGPETWAICTRRAGKLHKARSRLYRSQILQVNTRWNRDWKVLAEIYTMHSFCTVLESEVEKSMGKRKLAQQKPWKSGK